MFLTTIDRIKQLLGLQVSTDDELLQSLVAAESALIESYIGREVGVAVYSDIFSGNGGSSRLLRASAVQVVSKVMVDGAEITEAADITEQGYLLDGDRILLFGYRFEWGQANCRIDYTAGWSVAPAALSLACDELVAYRYRHRDRIGLVSKGLAGETTAFMTRDMPDHVRALINPYRRMVPV